MDNQSRQWERSGQNQKAKSPYESQENLTRPSSVQLGGCFVGSFCFGAPQRRGSTRQSDCAMPMAWCPDGDAPRVCNPLRELSQIPDSGHVRPRRSSGGLMAGEKVLYVCFDFSRLLNNELALLERGFDVTTVLGIDGLLARFDYNNYSAVIVDDAAVDDRQFVEQWLKDNYPAIRVIAFCDLIF